MSKKKPGFKELFRKYMRDEVKLERWQWMGMLMLIVVFAGFFGWVYEFIFYFFDAGTGEFYMQGGNFLPWINIYAIGSVLITFLTYKFKKAPQIVFILSGVITGVLEYFSGWLVYVVHDGARYWDYNTEIWNFGNIGGYICFRSVTFFAISGMFLMYVILPFFAYLSFKPLTYPLKT